jgi:DNA-binding XRE family transcriptional regulator
MSVDYKQQQYPNKLKVIRRKARYTQQHVAMLLGHNNTVTISAWEKGKQHQKSGNRPVAFRYKEKTPLFGVL